MDTITDHSWNYKSDQLKLKDVEWMKCRDDNLWRSKLWRLSFYHSPQNSMDSPAPDKLTQPPMGMT